MRLARTAYIWTQFFFYLRTWGYVFFFVFFFFFCLLQALSFVSASSSYLYFFFFLMAFSLTTKVTTMMAICQDTCRQANWLQYIFALYVFFIKGLNEKHQTFADTLSRLYLPVSFSTVPVRLVCNSYSHDWKTFPKQTLSWWSQKGSDTKGLWQTFLKNDAYIFVNSSQISFLNN